MIGYKKSLVLTVILFGLAMNTQAEEKPVFKDLPGVKAQEPFVNKTDKADCTSQLVEPYINGRRQLPVRMYTCTNGVVTYGSTYPPIGGLRPTDPYVHGEGPVKAPGQQ